MRQITGWMLAIFLTASPVLAQKAEKESPKKTPTAKKSTSTESKKSSSSALKKTDSSKISDTQNSAAKKPTAKKPTAKKSTAEKKNTTADKKKTDPKKPWQSLASTELKKKATEQVKKLTTTRRSGLLKLLNGGKPEELAKIPGIGKERADNIKKGRPYKKVEDIVDITGIGEKTFGSIIKHSAKL